MKKFLTNPLTIFLGAVLLGVIFLFLVFFNKPTDEEMRIMDAQYRIEQNKAVREELARQAKAQSRAARLNYAWRMEVVRACRYNGKFVLRGTDGRLWMSSFTNPGKAASNAGYEPFQGTMDHVWDPDTYMVKVGSGIAPKDICE